MNKEKENKSERAASLDSLSHCSSAPARLVGFSL